MRIIKRILTILKYPLMIFLVWYLINSGKLDFSVFKTFLSGWKILIIVLVLALYCLGTTMFSKRYQMFLTALGYKSSFFNIFKIIMVGLFYNNFLPGGTGGDLMRIYYLKSHMGMPIASGTAATLLDRIIGLLGLVVVALISMFWIIGYTGKGGGIFQEQSIMFIAAVVVVVVVIGGLMLLRVPQFYNFVEKILSKIVFGQHMVNILSTFRQLISNSILILKSLGICIVGHITTLTCISTLAYVMYGPSAMYAAIGVAGIVLLTSAVPLTPGNIGMTEWIADSLFRLFGVEGGAAIFVMWRAITLLFSLIGGLVYLRMGKQKNIAETTE